jgi:hypothetical protein
MLFRIPECGVALGFGTRRFRATLSLDPSTELSPPDSAMFPSATSTFAAPASTAAAASAGEPSEGVGVLYVRARANRRRRFRHRPVSLFALEAALRLGRPWAAKSKPSGGERERGGERRGEGSAAATAASAGDSGEDVVGGPSAIPPSTVVSDQIFLNLR